MNNDSEIKQALEYCREKYGKNVEVLPGCAMKETCFGFSEDNYIEEADENSRLQPITQYRKDCSEDVGMFCFWSVRKCCGNVLNHWTLGDDGGKDTPFLDYGLYKTEQECIEIICLPSDIDKHDVFLNDKYLSAFSAIRKEKKRADKEVRVDNN